MPFSLGFWAAAASRLFSWSIQSLTGTQTTAAYSALTNGSFFSFMNSTTSYNYSTDGLSWSTGTLPSSKSWKVAMGNGSRIVVAASTSTTAGAAYTTDGTTWTTANLPASNQLHDGIWDGTRFLIATSSTTAGIYYSTDGATWSSVDAGPAIRSIGFDGSSTWIAVDASTTATTTARKNTSNPTVSGSWSNITLPASWAWRSVVYGNGIWCAFTATSQNYATSTDGTTWTSRNLVNDFSAGDRNAVFANGKFYVIVNVTSSNQRLQESTDGINWTTALSYADTTGLNWANGWAVSSTKIVGVGSSPDNTYFYGAS